MKILLLLLANFAFLTMANAASDEQRLRSACPSQKAVLANILNCGENTQAANFAKNCSNYLASFNRLSGLALQQAMSNLESSISSDQSKNFVDTAKRLHSTLVTLKNNIALMQSQTSLVASYTESMIDFPEGQDDQTSAECFSTAFHDLQKVVNGMDQEIINMKNAYRRASSLLKTAASRSQNLGSVIPQAEELDSSPGASAPTNSAPTGKKIRASDISGTEEKKRP
jgi:hypothetical protein